MAKYQVVIGYTSEIIEVEEPTTDYQMLVDMVADLWESEGDVMYTIEDVEENGWHDDEFVIAGNHCNVLYHGGNFYIKQIA